MLIYEQFSEINKLFIIFNNILIENVEKFPIINVNSKLLVSPIK